LAGGTYTGHIAIFSIENGNINPYALLSEGHNTQIRSVIWDFSNNQIISGGEDSKICVWRHMNHENIDNIDNRSNLKVTREIPPRFEPY